MNKSIMESFLKAMRESGFHHAVDAKPDTKFIDLGYDSLDHVEIIMLAEDHFGMEIPDPDTDTLNSLESLLRYVKERL